MTNKIIVKVIIPNIDNDFDIVIPVNEQLWRVEKLIMKCIYDLLGVAYNPKTESYKILNKITGYEYDKNEIIIDTDIRNGTELLFVKEI